MRVNLICLTLLILLTVASPACSPTATTPPTATNAPLMIAVKEGKADVVRALLSGNDVDVNSADGSGNTPLIEASRFGHDEIARALIAHGANLQIKNKAGETALMLAVKNGHDDVVRILKEAGAKE